MSNASHKSVEKVPAYHADLLQSILHLEARFVTLFRLTSEAFLITLSHDTLGRTGLPQLVAALRRRIENPPSILSNSWTSRESRQPQAQSQLGQHILALFAPKLNQLAAVVQDLNSQAQALQLLTRTRNDSGILGS